MKRSVDSLSHRRVTAADDGSRRSGGVLAAARRWTGGESGEDYFRRRRVAGTRARSVLLHRDSDCGMVSGYGFISTRGTRWWLCMREILNGRKQSLRCSGFRRFSDAVNGGEELVDVEKTRLELVTMDDPACPSSSSSSSSDDDTTAPGFLTSLNL
ncbi:hypothetical protein F2Q68_00043761 [Brassica cretica]|uniref:Uncharacterized protein n=1 Tax=Brassica cretica TaxID=69181 RepID=A0A8S9LIS8_BRACR|nr:hypothetical protein F2Q68_00043761 [Brassica cretica]